MTVGWFSRFFSLGSPPSSSSQEDPMILEDIEAIQEEAQGLHDLMRIIQSSTHLYYGPELVPTQPSLSSDQEVNKVPSCWHTIPMYQPRQEEAPASDMKRLCLPGQLESGELRVKLELGGLMTLSGRLDLLHPCQVSLSYQNKVYIGGSRIIGEDQGVSCLKSYPIRWTLHPDDQDDMGHCILRYLQSSSARSTFQDAKGSESPPEEDEPCKALEKPPPNVRFILPEKPEDSRILSSSSTVQMAHPTRITDGDREEESMVILSIHPLGDGRGEDPKEGSEIYPVLEYHFLPSSLSTNEDPEPRMIQERTVILLQGQAYPLLPIYDVDEESVISDAEFHSQSKDESELDEGACVVCLSSDRTITLLPCRHQCICPGCAISLARIDPATCPLCRAEVSSWVRTHPGMTTITNEDHPE
ncbi:MAG: hypothetical protein DHS80DRAFT_25573 [Piptocephalis tieghemiana]|nr:MAG: hypothetical protein DHS80DRAFT_25573 [Piptocephalis tieghemiana]